MATRSEVLLYEEGYDQPIVFYQHFDGYELPHIVADDVKRGEDYLQDTPYLGRIVFSEMLRHEDEEGIENNDGYGISFSRVDLCSYTVEIHTSYTRDPYFVVNGDGYTKNEFLSTFLKPDGAFSWKKGDRRRFWWGKSKTPKAARS